MHLQPPYNLPTTCQVGLGSHDPSVSEYVWTYLLSSTDQYLSTAAPRAYLREQAGLFSGVTKWIDLPGDARPAAFPKVILQELHASGVLIYDGVVVRGRLIVHTPTAQNEAELT